MMPSRTILEWARNGSENTKTDIPSEGELFAARVREESAQYDAKPPLNPDREVPVVTAKSRYRHLPPQLARRQAGEDAKREIFGIYRNNDTGWDITVSDRSVSESLHGDMSSVRAEIVANLPALLRNAVRVESKPTTKGMPEVTTIHRLWSALNLDERLNRVKLTVREHRDGVRRQYAVAFVEMEPEVSTARTGDVALPHVPPSGSVIRLQYLLTGVKYDDGSAVFPDGQGVAEAAENYTSRPLADPQTTDANGGAYSVSGADLRLVTHVGDVGLCGCGGWI